ASTARSLVISRAKSSVEEQARYLRRGRFLLLHRSAIMKAGYFDECVGNVRDEAEHGLLRTLLERGASVALVTERLYHTHTRTHPATSRTRSQSVKEPA